MRWSNSFIVTLKEEPAEAEIISHKLLLKAGFVKKLASGIYTIMPLGMRVIEKVEKIVREELEKSGASELLLPVLGPAEIWKTTGRWDLYGKELIRVKDRQNKEFALSPTHEEVITSLVANELRSYRQLPINLYQIQVKFRDEPRPRSGILRAREFIMKDGYSFDRNEKDAEITYKKMFDTYCRIFKKCGFDFKVVEAETGAIGGSFSHEFMVLADNGEDIILVCDNCGYSANTNYYANKEKVKNKDICIKCENPLTMKKAIEIGHVFKLGTKYSKFLKAVFLDENGKEQYAIMGCYGIGISRIMAAAVEQSNDKDGIIWQIPIAPYQVLVTPLNMDDEKVVKLAEDIYKELSGKNIEVLIDDRNESAGIKFKDADLIGIPIRIIVGSKSIKEGKIELNIRDKKSSTQKSYIEMDNKSEIINCIKEIIVPTRK